MLITAEIRTWGDAWKIIGEEAYQELRAVIPQLPAEKEKYYGSPVLLDIDGMRALAKYKLEVSLKENNDEGSMLVKLAARVRALEAGSDTIPERATDGTLVQIAIPDMPLMYVNEVSYMEDACTDEVQDKLNAGWRILAVCPPNAQRRPDYIFGRNSKANR